MIFKNGIELTDFEYKELLIKTLNEIIEDGVKEEDYEICQSSKTMLDEIDEQNPEDIKRVAISVYTLRKIIKNQEKLL